MRIGHGYDVHRFAPELELILGGVRIEHDRGLLGHSDADVLCHAISDAILGACALGDIGQHFPDTDSKYKGASSLFLLKEVVALARKKNFYIENIDATLILQRPKVADYINEMRKNISVAAGLLVDVVSVKATTTEKLGFVGREEGIAAEAVVLMRSENE